MLQQGFGAGQRPNPEQPTEPPSIENEMQRLLQFRRQISQTFKREQISPRAFGMAAMAQSIQLTMLLRAKSSGTAGEVSLLQRPSSQAPAARSPRDNPGRRVR